MGETIRIETLDGADTFSGYLATPSGSGPFPGIVVIQEIFGVNAGIRAMCDDWAKAGFIALAPDMFWRLQPDVDLSDKTKAEWEEAFGLMKRFDIDAGIRDIEASLRAVKGLADSNGKVGVVGFCLGGRMAYLSATRTDSDASVAYYGGGIDQYLGEAHAIARPVLLHFAEDDGFIDKAAQAKIRDALSDHGRVTLHFYPGVDHAFARVDGMHRDNAAATLANGRTLDFFRAHLR
ncbi:dienelactone hydrolase family protein [Sphingosinicella soli]|uniref:Carboxymethylenebutenolidase n=1 Tax=Sphingosinicella soli TaxID=333708 RepID=A0A7W7B2Z1_9SPHN|nr:dienelactone hydrolase family protein [Sphingosinicella soli]MBB4633071.1 carboxymethylenebutenolidase [Sphingosinicella soli]